MTEVLDAASETATKAQMLLNLLGNSLKKSDHAGSVAIISEDQIPGGIEGYQDAIDALRADGYGIGTPKNQVDLSKKFDGCRGRTIQLVSTPEGRLLKH